MEAEKIYPYLCKHVSRLEEARYEFSDAKTIKTEQDDGLIKEEIKTIILGHSCEDHFDDVKKLLKEIHRGQRE